MEIKQSRNSNRVSYVFGEDELQYSLEDATRRALPVDTLAAQVPEFVCR